MSKVNTLTNYRVYFTNHDYYSQEEFSSLDEAIEYGKSKGFDFTVHYGSHMLAGWSYIGGLKKYNYYFS